MLIYVYYQIALFLISPICVVLLALPECLQGLHNILGGWWNIKCQKTMNGAETNCLETNTVKDNQFAYAQASVMC